MSAWLPHRDKKQIPIILGYYIFKVRAGKVVMVKVRVTVQEMNVGQCNALWSN